MKKEELSSLLKSNNIEFSDWGDSIVIDYGEDDFPHPRLVEGFRRTERFFNFCPTGADFKNINGRVETITDQEIKKMFGRRR